MSGSLSFRLYRVTRRLLFSRQRLCKLLLGALSSSSKASTYSTVTLSTQRQQYSGAWSSNSTKQEFRSDTATLSQNLHTNYKREGSDEKDVIAYHKTISMIQTKVATAGSTRTLHDEEDGKPAITLTVLDCETHKGHTQFSLVKPGRATGTARTQKTDVSRHTTYSMLDQHFIEDVELIYDHTQPRDTTLALGKLRDELEEHFERLKDEYESKVGKRWTPLRPWAREEWDWNFEVTNTGQLGEDDGLVEEDGRSE
ncbi:hypothetical protein EKO04_002921 [Ascochyta lentis]|uniref:Uncharacterized protein n=1 Tax=Ascochyta lentis TaxID=205686 RepID=A0A8H7MJI3_9PLEO|nr:hypothetical protein EKO04_002921 [Ascochyta lentis]